jgi:low affinity Fe/Cu permease
MRRTSPARTPPSRTSLRHLLTGLGVLSARPIAFVIFLTYAGAWIAFGEKFPDWHSIATLATWAMTLFIQRAEHRDTQAIHAKLDELLKANGKAENSLMDVDDQEPEEVEATRDQVKGKAPAP